MPCLQKYNPTLTKQEFQSMKEDENQSWYVWQDRWLCAKCESEAINSDLQKMQSLCAKEEDEVEIKEKDKFNESKSIQKLHYVIPEAF